MPYRQDLENIIKIVFCTDSLSRMLKKQIRNDLKISKLGLMITSNDILNKLSNLKPIL